MREQILLLNDVGDFLGAKVSIVLVTFSDDVLGQFFVDDDQLASLVDFVDDAVRDAEIRRLLVENRLPKRLNPLDAVLRLLYACCDTAYLDRRRRAAFWFLYGVRRQTPTLAARLPSARSAWTYPFSPSFVETPCSP